MTNKEKFNKFWSLYPRKVAKIVAERRWKKLSKTMSDTVSKDLHADEYKEYIDSPKILRKKIERLAVRRFSST